MAESIRDVTAFFLADRGRGQLRQPGAEPCSGGGQGPSELGPHLGKGRVRSVVPLRRPEACLRRRNMRLRVEVSQPALALGP